MAHEKLNRIIAGIVFLFVWCIYFMTVAPTLSFWDCGEFVACSYSLGVPHPPGTPLFVIFGKFVSMVLGFIPEKALRINLISTTGGALSAMMVYLIAIRFLIIGFGKPKTFWRRFALYSGGIISALCSAFASTVWFNNVEAEVYGANIALMLLQNWLIMKWADNRENPGSDRFIITIVFVAFLNIGLHVQAMLVLPSFFLYVILLDKEKLTDWRFWIIGVVLLMQAFAVGTFIWLAPLTFILTIFFFIFSKPGKKRQWRLVFWMCLVALLAYSVHIYIPIRSAQDPIIDENNPELKIESFEDIFNPESYAQFRYFLERKQYGSESMTEQMFTRHGSWKNQIWNGKHMGYGLYHVRQFHRDVTIYPELSKGAEWVAFDFSKPADLARLLIYLIPTFIMIYGMYALYQRNRENSLMFISLFLSTSFGMILYMNFKDGTVPGFAREVRERDYFFTMGYLYYAFWVGIGCAAIMNWLLDHKKEIVRNVVAPVSIVVLSLMPVVPLAANYKSHDRTGNYVPWDYSYNLLMSCEKDGILFTNGDNDTFPVWALQEVYGVRKDVRIVNLSLLNTGWYIEQLKVLEPKVPISFSLDEIAGLQHRPNPFEKDARIRYPVGDKMLNVIMPGRERHRVMRIQDIMVMNIVQSTAWKKPVYFAVTVSDDNKMGLDPYLQMEGLVYRVNQEPVRERINVEKTIRNLDYVYRFRGLGDGSFRLDDDTRKLLSNYSASFIGLALDERRPIDALLRSVESARKEAEDLEKTDSLKMVEKKRSLAALEEQYKTRLDRVLGLLNRCTSMVPDDWRPRVLLVEFLLNHHRYEEAEKICRQGIKVEPNRSEYHMQLAIALEKAEKYAEAIKVYQTAIAMRPDFYNAYESVANMYMEQGKKDSAVRSYEDWLRRHPGDRRAAQAIEALKAAEPAEPAKKDS